VVLARLGFENTYCLAMRGGDARAAGLERISDLAARAPDLEIFGDFEFFDRPEWRALVDRYGLRFGSRRAMDASLMYEALRSGSGDVISAYSTDGRIAAYGLTVLADDRGVIPPYDAIVLAGVDFLARSPEVAEAVASLAGRIDARAMRSLNAAVDLEGQRPEEVASTWVRDCLDADAVPAGTPHCGASGAIAR
jgi:osmoprotectant transport system permease protein